MLAPNESLQDGISAGNDVRKTPHFSDNHPNPWRTCTCPDCHARRCVGIVRMLQTDEGKLRLAELFAIERPAYTEERAEAIRSQVVDFRRQGLGVRKIAEKYRCHHRFVRAILDAAGVA